MSGTRPCVDCGILIKAVQRKSRCKKCQVIHAKMRQDMYNRRRLGSSQLFKTLSNGRLIPADFGCGNNTEIGYPIKKQAWMKYYPNENSSLTDKDLEARDKIVNEEIDKEGDWKREMLYNWRFDINEQEKPLTRREKYLRWAYHRNL